MDWQSMDTVPKDGTQVVLWHLERERPYFGAYHEGHGWSVDSWDMSASNGPFHAWMPIAPKPETADKALSAVKERWREIDRREAEAEVARAVARLAALTSPAA